jgi:hypothetical protein
MTQSELKEKIEKLERGLKSEATPEFAKKQMQETLNDLKSKLEAEKPKEKAPKKEKKAKEEKNDLESITLMANEMAIKAGFKGVEVDDLGNNQYMIEVRPATEENNQAGMVLNKYKDGTFEVAEMQAGKDGNFINVFGEYKSLKPALTQLLKGNKQKPTKVIDMRSETEKSEPKKSKKSDYDCDDLIKEAKERHAKAKKAAEVRAEAPKKTEATKDKEKIEKVYDNVEKHIEKNKLSKAQLEKLIAETKDLLKLLEKALKNL